MAIERPGIFFPGDRQVEMVDFVGAISTVAAQVKREKASLYLVESGFYTALRKLRPKLGGKFRVMDYDELIGDNDQIFLEDSVYSDVRWNFRVEDDVTVYNSVVVQAMHTGSIIVHGGLLGTTILSEHEWRRKDKILCTQALAKAVDNPRYLLDF